jgi:hypothetical protein
VRVWGLELISLADAPGILRLRSFQVAAIRTGGDPLGRRLDLRFSLSYRDVEELLADRGLHADHVTIWRRIQSYAPEMERRLRSKLKATNDSWRVDETYIPSQGQVGVLKPTGSCTAEPDVQYRGSRQ